MGAAGNLRDKYNLAVQAQDLAILAESEGNNHLSATSNFCYIIIQDIISNIKRSEPATMRLIAQNDLQKLRDMLADVNLPQITRNVINEVLSNIVQVSLNGNVGTPSTRIALPRDNIAEKYYLNHCLNQNLGTTERLGSLVHELTHVESGETYGNTSSFLLCDVFLTPEQLQQLGVKRIQELNDLRILCTDDVQFNDEQKRLLHEKIGYGFEDKLRDYANKFIEIGDRNPDDPIAVNIGHDGSIMRRVAASAPGQSSVFIEYDSVINQMLIYMHKWNIPPANPFYDKLRLVAAGAYDSRDASRMIKQLMETNFD